jgi:hypothetical protein
MDDATRQTRERREHAQDFLTANPSAHSVGIGGTIYDCNGYEGSRNMTDRELLELAAKAAGIELDWDIPINSNTPWRMSGEDEDRGPADLWNPLTDDGDALRLAVKCGIDLVLSNPGIESAFDNESLQYVEPRNSDPYAATRRAIVRAVAKAGEGM